MKANIFTLCDSVQFYEGKFVIVGTYDVLFIKDKPDVPVSINIAAQMVFEEAECGEHAVKIEAAEAATGRKLLELTNNSTVVCRAKLDTGILNAALADVPIILPSDGKYIFTLCVDDQPLAEMALHAFRDEPK